MNRQGTKGTSTIVSMNELVKAGYEVDWKKGGIVVSKTDIVLPVEIRSGTPVLPHEIRIDLTEEIERAKKTQMAKYRPR